MKVQEEMLQFETWLMLKLADKRDAFGSSFDKGCFNQNRDQDHNGTLKSIRKKSTGEKRDFLVGLKNEL